MGVLPASLDSLFVRVVDVVATVAVERRAGDEHLAMVLIAAFFAVGVVDTVELWLVSFLAMFKMFDVRWWVKSL